MRQENFSIYKFLTINHLNSHSDDEQLETELYSNCFDLDSGSDLVSRDPSDLLGDWSDLMGDLIGDFPNLGDSVSSGFGSEATQSESDSSRRFFRDFFVLDDFRTRIRESFLELSFFLTFIAVISLPSLSIVSKRFSKKIFKFTTLGVRFVRISTFDILSAPFWMPVFARMLHKIYPK